MEQTKRPQSLSIGQVVYVLSNDTQKIVPVRIVEEITIKKLDGLQVSWKVAVGPKTKEKIIDSARLNGDIYSNLEEIRNVLEKRLFTFLNQLITEAKERTHKWYGRQKNTVEQTEYGIQPADNKIDPGNFLEENFDTDNTQQNIPNNQNNILTREQLREKLKNELMGPENLTNETSGMITLPDGTYAKANIKFNENG